MDAYMYSYITANSGIQMPFILLVCDICTIGAHQYFCHSFWLFSIIQCLKIVHSNVMNGMNLYFSIVKSMKTNMHEHIFGIVNAEL